MQKNKIIIIALSLIPLTQAVSTVFLNYLTMDRGVIVNHAEAALDGGGGRAILENNEYFLFRGELDRISFEDGFGQEWEWAVPYFLCDDIPLVNPFNFNRDEVYTIVGTSKHAGIDAKSYSVDFIKINNYGTDIMRVAGVYEITVPEPGTYALMLGLASISYIAIKKRRKQ